MDLTPYYLEMLGISFDPKGAMKKYWDTKPTTT